MNQRDGRLTAKPNLTLSPPNATSNFESKRVVKFTAPSSSRLIRMSSSAICRRSPPMSSIKVSADRMKLDEQAKSSRIMDKRGVVEGLRVVRDAGSQRRPPCVEPATLQMRVTSWRFGNLEKSKARSTVSWRSTSGNCSAINTFMH